MAHLRSNLTIRIPRSLDRRSRRRHQGAAGLGAVRQRPAQFTPTAPRPLSTCRSRPPVSNNLDDELRSRAVQEDPGHRHLRSASATPTTHTVVITIRGIGEMEPHNPDSRVPLDPASSTSTASSAPTCRSRRRQRPGAVGRDGPGRRRRGLVFASGKPYEVLARHAAPSRRGRPTGRMTVLPFAPTGATVSAPPTMRPVRSGWETTRRPRSPMPTGVSTTCANAYALGTGGVPVGRLAQPHAYRRRAGTADGHPVRKSAGPLRARSGFHRPFRRRQHRQLEDRRADGSFFAADGVLEAVPGTDLGPPLVRDADAGGLHAPAGVDAHSRRTTTRASSSAFPIPKSKGYDNTALVGVDFGFEVQIDEKRRRSHPPYRSDLRFQPGQALTPQPARAPGME